MDGKSPGPEFGTRLRSVRKLLNLTQQQLAEKFGVREETIIRWEGGKHLPSTDALLTLLELEPRLDPGWLVTGNGDMFKSPEVKREECRNCVYWKGPFTIGIDENYGGCQESSPGISTMSNATGAGIDFGIWPVTFGNNWCGKYKERSDNGKADNPGGN